MRVSAAAGACHGAAGLTQLCGACVRYICCYRTNCLTSCGVACRRAGPRPCVCTTCRATQPAQLLQWLVHQFSTTLFGTGVCGVGHPTMTARWLGLFDMFERVQLQCLQSSLRTVCTGNCVQEPSSSTSTPSMGKSWTGATKPRQAATVVHDDRSSYMTGVPIVARCAAYASRWGCHLMYFPG
jgi:hypothetical protein